MRCTCMTQRGSDGLGPWSRGRARTVTVLRCYEALRHAKRLADFTSDSVDKLRLSKRCASLERCAIPKR